MSDLIPDEEREALLKWREALPSLRQYSEFSSSFLDGFRAGRRVSPVTREDALDMVTSGVLGGWNEHHCIENQGCIVCAGTRAVNVLYPLLSVSPPAEVADDMVERAAEAITQRSTWPSLHWPKDLSVQHRDVAHAFARAALTAALGVPVSPESEGKK